LLVSTIVQNYSTDFHEFLGKVAHGPQKKLLDICGNPDQVSLGLVFGDG